MQNNPNEGKRRPVDALFGESNTSSSLPNYVVEPPMPANQVTPPIEFDAEPRATSTPAPSLFEHELTSPVDLATTPSLPEPAPISTASQVHLDDPRFLTLSFQIERFYNEVKTELHDSPTLTDYCFDLLLQARQAYERRDYPMTEYFIQATDAKLKRSAKSAQASRRPIVFALWAWELVAFLIGGSIIAISYIQALTLFGLPINAELLVLLRSLGWGMVGGVFGALSNLPRFVQFREYDPAYNMNYFAHPLIGLLIGAALFVISQAGILAGNIVIGNFQAGPIFLYVFALLAGFKQEYVIEFFDNVMQAILRKPQPPSGMKHPNRMQ